MPGTDRKPNSKIVTVLLTLMLSACATSSPPSQPPVVVYQVKLTPLPESVRNIDSRSSHPYLQRASDWLKRVDESLSIETSK